MEKNIVSLFPEKFRQVITDSIKNDRDKLEEIRVRINRSLELVLNGEFITFDDLHVNEVDGQFILNQLSGFSRYKFEEELKQGYITVTGGHRVGFVGRTVLEKGSIKQIQSISSFNIRIASEKIDVAQPMIRSIVNRDSYHNTLIIGPPQSGKTTLLRDLCRLIGTGWGTMTAKKVGVVDERSEIAGSKNGIPHYQVGKRTDVLDGCPKSEGMMLMIRSMSPDVIVVDEIGSHQDIEAIQETIRSGVRLICTLHSDSYQSVLRSKQLSPLIENNYFNRFVILDRNKKITILNHQGRPAWQNGGEQVNWIGAILLIIASSAIGFEKAARLKKRPVHLLQLKAALKILEAEIVYSQDLLADVCLRISTQIKAPINHFFQQVGEKMVGHDELFDLWNSEVDHLMNDSALEADELTIIKQFGQTLGHFDLINQQKQIELTIIHLDRILIDAQNKYTVFSKVYRGIGVLSGILIALILI